MSSHQVHQEQVGRSVRERFRILLNPPMAFQPKSTTEVRARIQATSGYVSIDILLILALLSLLGARGDNFTQRMVGLGALAGSGERRPVKQGQMESRWPVLERHNWNYLQS